MRKECKTFDLKKGSSLVEVLIALFVFSLMAMTFYMSFALGTIRMSDAQGRLQAMTLATEQMEKIRNLAYEDVGFTSGVPGCVTHCVLLPEEEKTLSGVVFFVTIGIQYKDDPDDGTLASHSDPIPTDYKRVTVRVEWGDRGEQQRVEMISRFVPPGIEQDIPNTGALSINVSNYAADPVGDVRVVVNGVAGNFFTDDTGNLFLLGVPVNTNGYSIQLTKSGYETLQTLPYPPVGAFPPKNAPVAVADGLINVGNFDLNPLTDMTIQMEDPFGNAVPEMGFLLSGGRRLDNNPSPTNYEYDHEVHTSNGDGKVHLTDRSGGQYTLSFPLGSAYELWKSDLSGDAPEKLLFPYGGVHTAKVILLKKSDPGILVSVRDSSNDSVLSGATVRVTDDAGTYEATRVTDALGTAYFPESVGNMVSGTRYIIHAEVGGYSSGEEEAVPTELIRSTVRLRPN